MRNLMTYAPNAIRVLAVAFVAGNVTLAVAVKAGADSTREGLRSFGRSVLRYADGRSLNQTRAVSFNGADIRMVTGSTRDSVRQVLDFYAARCREIDGGMSEQVLDQVQRRTGRRAFTLPREVTDTLDVNPAGTLIRFTTDTEGMLVCFDAGRQPTSYAQFIQRMVRAVESGNLTGAADFRYVYASRLDTNSESTHVVGFWTENTALNIPQMFPTTGDAQGRAVPGLPRPQGLRRVLAAHERGTPYSYTTFLGRTSSAAIEAQLRRDMVSAGWQLLSTRRSDLQLRPGEHLLNFERGREAVVFHVTHDRGETSVVQLSEEAAPIR